MQRIARKIRKKNGFEDIVDRFAWIKGEVRVCDVSRIEERLDPPQERCHLRCLLCLTLISFQRTECCVVALDLQFSMSAMMCMWIVCSFMKVELCQVRINHRDSACLLVFHDQIRRQIS